MDDLVSQLLTSRNQQPPPHLRQSLAQALQPHAANAPAAPAIAPPSASATITAYAQDTSDMRESIRAAVQRIERAEQDLRSARDLMVNLAGDAGPAGTFRQDGKTPVAVTNQSDARDAVKSGDPVVVVMTMKGCGACGAAKKYLQAQSPVTYATLDFQEQPWDEGQRLLQQFKGLPIFMCYNGGEMTASWVGFPGDEAVKRKILDGLK